MVVTCTCWYGVECVYRVVVINLARENHAMCLIKNILLTHTHTHTHTQVSDTDGIGEACAGGKMLEFRPKARVKDVENYIDSCRTKFGCFESDGSEDDLVGEWVKGLTYTSTLSV